MILNIEMIPKSSWKSNLRSILKQSQWDIVRNICYEKAAYGCEICHTRPKKGQLHCHEVWEFDDKMHIQKLVRLEAVCGLCHSCKHIGFTVMQHFNASKDLEPVIDHFLRVNQITLDEFQEYLDKELKIWQKRSEHAWDVNIYYLEDYLFNEGISMNNLFNKN